MAWKLPHAAGESLSFTKLWENEDIDGESYASPVSSEGLIFQASNDGQFFIMEAKTGKTVCRKEADFPWAGGSPGAEPANIYPSLTFIGKRLILSDDAGHTLVVEPGREYRLAGRNSLDKGTGASPLADGKHLFLRGGKWLYCIGAK